MRYLISAAAVLRGGSTAAALACTAWAFAAGDASAAAVLNRIHSFCTEPGCVDGITPFGPLVGDEKGRIFGTTLAGGVNGLGTIFELLPKKGGAWRHQIICSIGQSNCPEGAPWGDLIVDRHGNLYGTSPSGGANGQGSVFELKHGRKGWTYSVLYNFCSEADCTDGSQPVAGLTYTGQSSRIAYDGKSPLFGTATQGPARGVVFELVRNGSRWSESVIHRFDEGNTTSSPLLMDNEGNLFGTGTSNTTFHDFFFRLAHDTWKFDTLHEFCNLANCADGSGTRGRPVIVANGTIFGVTQSGGQYSNGTVYSLTPGKRGYKFRVVYDFCFSGIPCSEGRNPYGVTIDPSGSGSLVGATGGGGANDGGAIFRLENGKAESVLYSFCAANSQNCPDGADPSGGVIVDDKGRVFGGTFYGGKTENAGVAYELIP